MIRLGAFVALMYDRAYKWRGSQIRITSARRASRAERRDYEDSL